MKRIIFSSLATLAVVAFLAACGSSVKLDEVPVETRSGSVVTPPSNTNDVSSKAVAPVEVAATSIVAAGPLGV
ncbi:MAG: peptidoglycan-associated lipoprotein, partial [Polaromonas sp.]